jgi:hypothetical protein
MRVRMSMLSLLSWSTKVSLRLTGQAGWRASPGPASTRPRPRGSTHPVSTTRPHIPRADQRRVGAGRRACGAGVEQFELVHVNPFLVEVARGERRRPQLREVLPRVLRAQSHQAAAVSDCCASSHAFLDLVDSRLLPVKDARSANSSRVFARPRLRPHPADVPLVYS